MLLTHGRGATAESILELAREFPRAEMAYLAPQATDNTWYPYSFLRPRHENEPWLTSALEVLGAAVAQVQAAGIPPERLFLLGFSQGACLTLEFAARHAQRYGGVIGLSGGLIGPDDTPRDYAGHFAGTPVYLGCSDIDAHIPAARVRQSAAVFNRLGAQVNMRIFPNMAHTVNHEEIKVVREMVAEVDR